MRAAGVDPDSRVVVYDDQGGVSAARACLSFVRSSDLEVIIIF